MDTNTATDEELADELLRLESLHDIAMAERESAHRSREEAEARLEEASEAVDELADLIEEVEEAQRTRLFAKQFGDHLGQLIATCRWGQSKFRVDGRWFIRLHGASIVAPEGADLSGFFEAQGDGSRTIADLTAQCRKVDWDPERRVTSGKKRIECEYFEGYGYQARYLRILDGRVGLTHCLAEHDGVNALLVFQGDDLIFTCMPLNPRTTDWADRE